MTVYFYKATDLKGQCVEGDVEAPDYQRAVKAIQSLNYFPIQISEGKSGKNRFSFDLKLNSGWFNGIANKELMTLTHQLATLVDSGLTLDQSLFSLVKLAENDRTREVLADVQNRVHSGSTFAEALKEHPKVFSKLYINMVRAGETGGTLSTSLTRLADYLEKLEDLKNNMRSAMVYPAILFFVGGAAVAVLLTVVIPQFSKLFEEMGQALPLPTKIMLGVSGAVVEYWWAVLLLIVAAAAGLVALLKNERGRLLLDALVLRLPLFGTLVRKIEVSRFSLTLATLLKSGVPVLPALQIVRSILGNRVIVSAMDHLKKGLKGGKGLSGPLQETGVFPAMAVHMITVGETSGSLDAMLEKVAKTYDREVEQAVKQILTLLEPFMILIMAAIIGFIVISMLMAIFSINDVSF